MYKLKVVTTEEISRERDAFYRFNDLRNRILRNETCISSIYLIDNENGEILDEYKRL